MSYATEFIVTQFDEYYVPPKAPPISSGHETNTCQGVYNMLYV